MECLYFSAQEQRLIFSSPNSALLGYTNGWDWTVWGKALLSFGLFFSIVLPTALECMCSFKRFLVAQKHQENLRFSSKVYISTDRVTNRGLRRSSSLLSLPGNSTLRHLLLDLILKLPWDTISCCNTVSYSTTALVKHTIPMCVYSLVNFMLYWCFYGPLYRGIWRMRRQLVPGLVVRLTVIKAKTRPGIEASSYA